MTQFIRCDTCAAVVSVEERFRFEDDDTPSWIRICSYERGSDHDGERVVIRRERDYCGWPCVRDHVTARTLIDG